MIIRDQLDELIQRAESAARARALGQVEAAKRLNSERDELRAALLQRLEIR